MPSSSSSLSAPPFLLMFFLFPCSSIDGLVWYIRSSYDIYVAYLIELVRCSALGFSVMELVMDFLRNMVLQRMLRSALLP